MSLSFPSGTHPLARSVFSIGTVADLKAAALAALILAVDFLEPLARGSVLETSPGPLGVM